MNSRGELNFDPTECSNWKGALKLVKTKTLIDKISFPKYPEEEERAKRWICIFSALG